MSRSTPFFAPRPARRLLWCALPLLLGACFFDASPAKLNRQIEQGSAAKALEEINLQLTKNPSSPALNLLAAKAQLVLCAKENCPTTNPDKLSLIAGLLQAAGPAPVKLDKNETTLSAGTVISYAIPLFAKLSPQPDSLLTLSKSLPDPYRQEALGAVFTPALEKARATRYAAAANELKILGSNENIPAPARTFALALAGMFENTPADTESEIIALRSLNGEIPPGATALVPWALLAQNSVSGTTSPARQTLTTLPSTLENWKVSNVLTERAKAGLTQELNTIRESDTLKQPWAKSFDANNAVLALTLQRLSLSINPNQLEVWNTYLPTLISSAASGTVPDITEGLTFSTLSATRLSSETQQQLAAQLLQAATTLQQQPGTAAPLLVMAGSLPLTRQQQIDTDKLAQQLILKAAAASDVTATTMLAKFKPEVALNNRQAVVPLLLANIRQSLRTQNFERAISTAGLLQNTLDMDVQLDPIILEEFSDEMKRINIAAQLDTESPDLLLQDADTVALDIGPLFRFMQSYFEKQPKIVTAQLTTLIANARGTYGPATAMYRLNHLFPEDGMPATARQEWLNQAITEAISADSRLSGAETVNLAIRLADKHPGLSPAPLLEAALSRTSSLNEYRAIWKASTTPMRNILATIRPQYTSFMHGVDAYEAGHLGAAASSFSEITEPQWYNQAKSYFGKMQEILASISGVYVPVSSLSSTKTAAIILAPQGLGGGALQTVSVTFVNRLGTYNVANPTTYNSTPAAIRRITFTAPINLDTRTISLSEDVLDQLADAGTFTQLFGSINALTVQPGSTAHSGILQATMGAPGGVRSNLTLTRTLVSPEAALRPDGTYTVQSALNKAVPGTETILPAGTNLTVTTGAEPTSPPSDFSLSARYVYPLTGTLHHPSTPNPIAVEGAYDPATFAFEFTFSYPLPTSHQPVKARVRCQALAGPLVCGAYHLHSPRLQYATLVAGMQTQETLAAAARKRETTNTSDYKEMLAIAAEYQPPQPETQPEETSTPLPLEASATIVSATTTSSTLTSATLTAPVPNVTPTQTFTASPTLPISTTEPEEEFEPDTSATIPAQPEKIIHAPAPATVTLTPGQPISNDIPAGVFIHKTTAKPAAN